MKLKIHALQPSRWLLGQNIVQGEPIVVDTSKLHATQLEEVRTAKGISITTEAGAKVLFDEAGEPHEVKAADPQDDGLTDEQRAAAAAAGKGGAAKANQAKPK